jgi:hypothetical protein
VIHIRIEDTLNGCLAFSTLNLIVNTLTNIIDPTPLTVCDDATADGVTAIDLNVKDNEITNGQDNLVVTHHSSASDAASGSNPLPIPYVNTNVNEQVFVRVLDPQTGCIRTTTLDITILDTTVINTEDHYLDACDTDYNGISNFDLTSIIDDVLEGLTNATVTFHETNEDAISGTNPIADETNYENINLNEQVIFVRVESNTTGCAAITPIEIHTNLLLTATNIRDVSACDEGNDSSENFSFADIAVGIINDIPDITITFYESEEDRANQTNAIDPTIDYENQSNPQTIYLTLTSPTCTEQAEIELIVNPIIEFESIITQTVCDEDQDGLTSVDLSQFDALVTGDQTGFSITYFLSQEDADSNTNPLPNFYTNTSNPFQIYPSIRFDETGCAHVNSFEVSVLEAPITSAPSEIVICDADRDGLFGINLTNSIF